MSVGNREGEATLVLPFSSFAQALNNAASPQLSDTALAKRKRAAEALTARLNLVPVDVSVRFAPLTVSSADLLSLAVGDVLLLRHPPGRAAGGHHERRDVRLRDRQQPPAPARRRHRPDPVRRREGHRMTAPRTDSSQDSQTVSAVVVAAARAAASLVPAMVELVPGNPVSDPDTVPLPPGAASAVSAGLSGEVSGDMVLVISAEVVEALNNSPVGKMDVAAALRPALEAAAATLGRVRVASERVEEPVAALDGLRDKGMFVAVPLLADGEHQATFALQVTLPNTRSQRGSLDLLRHVAMEVTVEIGRTRMTVQELLSLHPGEVVELDRAASAPGRPARQRHAHRPRGGRRRRRGLRPADQRDRDRRGGSSLRAR
jgi:flagellar motor switch protein FliN/FliY